MNNGCAKHRMALYWPYPTPCKYMSLNTEFLVLLVEFLTLLTQIRPFHNYTGYNDKNDFTWEAVISPKHRTFHKFKFEDLNPTQRFSKDIRKSLSERTLTPIVSIKEQPNHSYLRDCGKFSVNVKCEIVVNKNGTLSVSGDSNVSSARRRTIIPGLPSFSLTKFHSATLYDIHSRQPLEEISYPSGPLFVQAGRHCAVLKVTKFISSSEITTLYMQKRSSDYGYEYRIV